MAATKHGTRTTYSLTKVQSPLAKAVAIALAVLNSTLANTTVKDANTSRTGTLKDLEH